jgi:tetratricopeptide (TPR) repeat protein
LTLLAALIQSPPLYAQTPSDAQQLESRGDWKGAEEIWRQLLKQNTTDYRLWASLGIALSHQDRFADALTAYRKALALHPNDAQTELNLGIAYFKMGRLSEAIAPLRAAARSLGSAPQTNVLLGMSLYGTAHYREATPYLENACTFQPANLELQRTLAQNYLYSGAYDQAMVAFKKMLVENPDSPQVHVLLGEAYDAANREDLAIEEFRAATEAAYLPNAYFGLGYLLWKTHNYQEAAREFEKELARDSNNSQALAYLADILLKQGDVQRAETLLRRSISLRPDNHLAFVDLGTIETEHKQFQAAKQHLKRAVSLDFKQADAHYRLARLNRATGDTAQAEREFALVKQLEQHKTDQSLLQVSGAVKK